VARVRSSPIYMIVARFGRASLGCPDEGVWAYVGVATHGGVLKIAELCSAAQTRASGPTWGVATQGGGLKIAELRSAAQTRASGPTWGVATHGARSRLPSFARLPRRGRLGLRECET
jgi:hypothetical protein